MVPTCALLKYTAGLSESLQFVSFKRLKLLDSSLMSSPLVDNKVELLIASSVQLLFTNLNALTVAVGQANLRMSVNNDLKPQGTMSSSSPNVDPDVSLPTGSTRSGLLTLSPKSLRKSENFERGAHSDSIVPRSTGLFESWLGE